MFWGPAAVQITTPQAMEKTWLMFGSLQMINMITQLKLKTPTNAENLSKVLQSTASTQFFDNYRLYNWLKNLAGDKNITTD